MGDDVKVRQEIAKNLRCPACKGYWSWCGCSAQKREDALKEMLAELLVLFREVAHRAWHLLDEGGEVPDNETEIMVAVSDALALGEALDALEAAGWEPHPDD